MIQIIDGFRINASVPIDSRFVVENETERDNITNKYHGLRVWVTDTNTPWYWNGTVWKKESDNYVTSTSGSAGFIPKFTGTNPYIIGDSQISDNGTNVTVSNNLVVGGNITFGGVLNGNLNADNITTGNLSLNRLQTGISGQIIRTNGSGVAEWVNLSGLTIGTSTNSDRIKISGVNNSDEYRLIIRKDGTSLGNYLDLYSNNNGLKLKNDGSGNLRILAHNGSVSNPPYSFGLSTNTGIYYDGALKFSLNGGYKLGIFGSYINFGDPSTGTPIIRINNSTSANNPSYTWYGDSDTGMYRPGVNAIGFSSNGNLSLLIDSSVVNFGALSTGSPRIRLGNNTTSNSPSYTWYDNDQTGMYRPEQDVIGFSTGGVERIRIGNSGISMLNKNRDWDDSYFSILANDGDYYLSWIRSDGSPLPPILANTTGNSTLRLSMVTMPSSNIDRIITVMFSNESDNDLGDWAKPRRISLFVENGVDTDEYWNPDDTSNWEDYSISSIRVNSESTTRIPGSSCSIFVPAGCRWCGFFGGSRSDNTPRKYVKVKVTIQKLGLS